VRAMQFAGTDLDIEAFFRCIAGTRPLPRA
jgi:hypothetical protein